MQIRAVGIDLGKTTFHLVALGASGNVLVKKKFTQKQLLAFTANMQTSLIGLEACCGAHFLGRALKQQGHDVRLIAAQFVKPFVKSNKNDFVDAEAIAEAVERKNMRFVPIKTDDQLDLQAMHRCMARSRATAVLDWRQGEAAGHQQARQHLSAQGAHPIPAASNAVAMSLLRHSDPVGRFTAEWTGFVNTRRLYDTHLAVLLGAGILFLKQVFSNGGTYAVSVAVR
jgi:transposase